MGRRRKIGSAGSGGENGRRAFLERYHNNRPAPVVGAKRDFAERVVRGEGLEAAVRGAFGPLVEPGREQEMAQQLMGESRVVHYFAQRLREFDLAWEEMEPVARAVLTRAMMGCEADGEPILLSPEKLEANRLDVAKSTLMLLGRNAPGAFVDRAREEDRARLTQRELAMKLIGPGQVEKETA